MPLSFNNYKSSNRYNHDINSPAKDDRNYILRICTDLVNDFVSNRPNTQNILSLFLFITMHEAVCPVVNR